MAKTINRLDDLTIRNAALPAGKLKCKLSDGDGLFVTITRTSKRFDQRYFIDGKDHSIVIGSYPEMGLSAARDKARAIRAKVKEGIDPVAERERTKAKEAAD